MFVIRKDQFDAFKVPFRKKASEKMLADLQEKNIGKVYESGRDLIIEDTKGNRTALNFSSSFIAESITKPSGLKYKFGYDDDDKLTIFSFPGNESIGFSHKEDLIDKVYLNKDCIKISYDNKKRIAEIISQDDKSQRFFYNSNGQVESIVNRAGESKKIERSIKVNHLIYSIQDSLNRITEIETDPLGGGNRIVFPDGSFEETIYEENLHANVTKLRNGSKKTVYYDEFNPSRVEWEDGNYLNVELNGKQEVITLENASGTISFEYDDKNRVVSENFQGNKVAYKYDEDGLLIEMIYPSGFIVKYNYDEDGRLKNILANDNKCEFRYAPKLFSYV